MDSELEINKGTIGHITRCVDRVVVRAGLPQHDMLADLTSGPISGERRWEPQWIQCYGLFLAGFPHNFGKGVVVIIVGFLLFLGVAAGGGPDPLLEP